MKALVLAAAVAMAGGAADATVYQYDFADQRTFDYTDSFGFPAEYSIGGIFSFIVDTDMIDLPGATMTVAHNLYNFDGAMSVTKADVTTSYMANSLSGSGDDAFMRQFNWKGFGYTIGMPLDSATFTFDTAMNIVSFSVNQGIDVIDQIFSDTGVCAPSWSYLSADEKCKTDNLASWTRTKLSPEELQPVPLPAAAPLLLAGLGAFGALRALRRRK